jgi:hypothetical protein
MALAVDCPDAYKPALAVVAPVLVFAQLALEDARGELEIKAALPEIPAALGLIPLGPQHAPFTIRYLRTTLNG